MNVFIVVAFIFSGSAISSSSKGDDTEECPPEYEEYLKLRCRRRSTVATLAELKTVLKEECDDDTEFCENAIKEDEEAPNIKYWNELKSSVIQWFCVLHHG